MLVLSTTLGACGIMPPKMRDTKVPSGANEYDMLAQEATKLTWKSERSPGNEAARDGKYFYMLRVTTTDGGKIYFTQNNLTGNMAFTCAGGALDDTDACHDAANKLFGPAFHGKYE
jgi:hypothetical protein